MTSWLDVAHNAMLGPPTVLERRRGATSPIDTWSSGLQTKLQLNPDKPAEPGDGSTVWSGFQYPDPDPYPTYPRDFCDDGDEIEEEEEEEEQGNIQTYDSWVGITYEEFLVKMETARYALEAKLASERSVWEHLVWEDDDVEETELEEGEDQDEVEAGMVGEAGAAVDVADMSMLSYYYHDKSSFSLNFDADASLIRDCDFETELDEALAYEADLEDFDEDGEWGFDGLSMA
ncbi:hypothetical protein OE88DRAFT_1646784 [Heliocybe sulcata]|uniref:Uncharacterized protein n=1 Tax=Heliocybe sulcata TaxID=5364 RepID=A0A5C3N4E9_9AGAM|nr:hypothetical protein OE88DRAFT_1646784 [Heliocybe sulcata]